MTETVAQPLDIVGESQNDGQTVQVYVFRPLLQSFSYAFEGEDAPQKGDLVDVPFGRNKIRGVVAGPGPHRSTLEFSVKKIAKIYPSEYRLEAKAFSLAEWIASYYFVSMGEVLSAMTSPAPLQKTKIWEPQATEVLLEGLELKPSQQLAVHSIAEHLGKKPVLLHGVTGSGKTEVYLHFIDQTLAQGKSCLFLLPEITLTRETLRKLGHRYSNMLLYHSGMSLAERRATWVKSRSGGPHLLVGARSSLFCPLENLGLIVVDEEHDQSYKQDCNPRYQGRDLAIVKAHQTGAGIILGSATPSLESYKNAVDKKYALVEMLDRISTRPLPTVHVVDLTEERRETKRYGAIMLSRDVQRRVKVALLKKHQVIFFLNRRGFSTAAVCPACGSKMGCPHCSVALTHYRKANLMICHHCDYRVGVPEACPHCAHQPMMFKGMGTEKVHDVIQQFFPDKKIVRIDGSVDGDKDIQAQLAAFMEGEGDILLGTQIISKGLDSPKITLSVALNADLGLSLPDFRAAEKDFQLLTQLAGRVGRGELVGECVFQTHDPEHYAIRHAVVQDYKAFYHEESAYRQQLSYPPFSRLARLVFMHSNEEVLSAQLNILGKVLRKIAEQEQVSLLGPAPAPLQKVKTRFRWHIVAKSSTAAKLSRFLSGSLNHLLATKQVEWFLDRDPQSTM
jgi:primosomal protein N' (replication factor Y) (superfamily II helicase)